MLIKKCDKCKKEIRGRDEVVGGLGWPEFSLLTLRTSNHCVPEETKLLQPNKMAR
jgi:hypothetical protein